MRNTFFHLSKELSKHHEVLSLDINDIPSIHFWKSIYKFQPQIIHYVPGPSIISFIILKILQLLCDEAETVMSATHPSSFRLSKIFFRYIKPELILIQSYKSESDFMDLGCKTRFFPSGIDIEKFAPVSKDMKNNIRRKYNLDPENSEKFVLLHVGSIKSGRGIENLIKLQGLSNQVIIIGNKSMGIENNIYKKAIDHGCIVLTNYFDNIEEFYALSDCYIFPTPPNNKKNSIEIPLSVLEAMACNLPVITTKFGALARIFKAGDGLIFVKDNQEFLESINTVKNIEINNIKTRDNVMPYTWERLTKMLENYYIDLISKY